MPDVNEILNAVDQVGRALREWTDESDLQAARTAAGKVDKVRRVLGAFGPTQSLARACDAFVGAFIDDKSQDPLPRASAEKGKALEEISQFDKPPIEMIPAGTH